MPSLPHADVGDGIELQGGTGSHGRYKEEEGDSTRGLLGDASGEGLGLIKGGLRRRWGRWSCVGLMAVVFLVLGSAGLNLIGGADMDDQDISQGDGSNPAEIPVSRPDIDGWMAYHDKLEENAAEIGAGTRVLLLGDSITEELLGTSVGMPRNWGDPAVWQEYYEPLGTLNLGISGDQTQHLLWRLQNGELPDLVQPESIMIAIGTNNLGYGMTPQETVLGIEAVVKYVTEQRPDALVLVMALFPRGDQNMWLSGMPWGVVDEVNELLEHAMLGFGRNVRFMNCNERFVVTDDTGQRLLNDKLMMSDNLHPTGEGLGVWSACVEEDIRSGLTDP